MTKFLNNFFELKNFVIEKFFHNFRHFVFIFLFFGEWTACRWCIGNVMIAPRIDNKDRKANALQCRRISV